MFRKLQLFIALFFAVGVSNAQKEAVLSGGLETNMNVFIRDSLIGASNTPQYDRQLSGGESWLDLNCAYQGFNIGVRFDVFTNSNLLNPRDAYSDYGIGRWYINKQVDRLNIEVGYIYDQIGSGVIYRAYEQRPLLIDNALIGVKLAYAINDDWTVKGFGGKQKWLFGAYDAIVKGANVEGYLSVGLAETPVSFSPGIGFVNRTLSDDAMAGIISEVKSYNGSDRFFPEYNVYLATIYNTLSYNGFIWFAEIALKSEDTFYDENASRLNSDGTTSKGRYVKKKGSVLYSSISYSKGRFGITLEGKRTENFNIRTNPSLQLNRGLINWLPPMSRVNTYRLTARYVPAVRDLSELAFQADVRFRFSKKWSTNINFSTIQTLDGDALYQEIFSEFTYKYGRKGKAIVGLQLQNYNQEVYETKPGQPTIKTITPYIDVLYKLSRKKSLRIESQYMITEQDYGNWFFALAELGIAPHWIFESSIMYNTVTGPKSPTNNNGDKVKVAYPTFGVTYSRKSNRFSLRYVKQVEGIVCSGGVCRIEPAFSGFKFSVNSTF